MRLFADMMPPAAPAPAQGGDPMRLFADMLPPQPAQQQPNAATKPGAGDTFIHSLLNSATFGLADRATSVLDSGISHLIPSAISERTVSPSESYAQIKKMYGEADTANPTASLLGTGAGMLAPSGAALRLLERAAAKGAPWAVKALRVLAPEAPSVLGNVARASVAGATGAVATNVVETGKVDDNTFVAGGTGAVLGPVGAKLVGMAAKGVGKAAGLVMDTRAGREVSAAMSLLAGKLSVKPAELQAAADTMRTLTGQPASIAQLLSAHDAGKIRELAEMNPGLGAGLQDFAAKVDAKQPAVLASRMAREGQSITPRPAGASGPPDNLSHVTGIDRPDVQDYASLDTTRRQTMDTAMEPIRSNPVSLTEDDAGLLKDVLSVAPPRRGTDLHTAVGQVFEDLATPGGVARLTVGQLDTLRQQIAAKATGADSHAVRALADEVSGLIEKASPEYAAAIARYNKHSDQIRGFEYGQSGQTLGNIGANTSANDKGFLQRSILSPEGRMGFASGVTARNVAAAGASEAGAQRTASSLAEAAAPSALNRQALGSAKADQITASSRATSDAQASLTAATPPRIRPSGDSVQSNVATAAVETAGGMHGRAIVHAVKAIGGLFGSGKMSPEIESRVLEFLTDPDPTRQAAALAILKRVGASAQDLLRIQTILAGVIGAKVGPMTTTPPLHGSAQ